MKLNPEYFNASCSGDKWLEFRLYDEKRQKLKLRDRIIFTNTENTKETLEVEIVGLHVCTSFDRLCIEVTLDDDYVEIMEFLNKKYPHEEQIKNGVIGISFRLLVNK